MSGAGGGGFVLVVGPSGAGKDTLLRLARERLAGEARVVFARRLVTRPAGPDEDNDEVAWPDFEAGEATPGAFALSWRAHGLGYAVPASALGDARAGRVVVCNASRRAVAGARARLPGAVSVVEVTAPPGVLAARIAARGRETEAEALARLSRAVPPVGADAVVVNDGPPERGAGALVAHLLARAGGGAP